jgi:hypothetical protein
MARQDEGLRLRSAQIADRTPRVGAPSGTAILIPRPGLDAAVYAGGD